MHQRESGEIPEEFRLWEPTNIGSEEWYVGKYSHCSVYLIYIQVRA